MNPHTMQTRKLGRSLDMIDALIDGETHQGRLLALETTRELLQSLWCEADDSWLRWESERPRRQAEARIAYHVENDTLDLY